MRSKPWVPTPDGRSVSRVYFAFIVLDGRGNTFLTEHPPVLLNEGGKNRLLKFGEMGDVQLGAQDFTVFGVVVFFPKIRIYILNLWGIMDALADESANLDIWEHRFPFILGMREPTVIEQRARKFSALTLTRR